MTIELSPELTEALERLAVAQGRGPERLIEQAVREYLEAALITDLNSSEVGEIQLALLPELADPQTKSESWSTDTDETR